MAWRCSGKTNSDLILNMSKSGIFHSDRVSKAMMLTDRANYVMHKDSAYEDSPQGIGHGVTISAPHMHAYASEYLLPYLHPGAKVLDVGSGSGYLTAVFHRLVGSAGTVVGIDHVPELVEWSVDNLRTDGLGEALAKKEIEMVTGDGRQGFPSSGPYDAIHVGAAAPTLPSELVNQLASPGRMFIPVGTHAQYIQQVDKDENGNVTTKKIMGVSYVPLTDREQQRPL